MTPRSSVGEGDSSSAMGEDDPLPRLLENQGLFRVIVTCKELNAGLDLYRDLPQMRLNAVREQAFGLFLKVRHRSSTKKQLTRFKHFCVL